jgi:hypothetical protein
MDVLNNYFKTTIALRSSLELIMKTIKISLVAVITVLLCVAIIPASQAGSKNVTFGKGKSSTTISGKIKGDNTMDYLVRANAGQKLIVDIKGSKMVPYFNIMPPGSTGEAIYNGSMDGSHYEGVLDKDGDWIIRVYQMGDAKDANKTNSYKLKISIPAGAKSGAEPASGTAVAEKACLAAVAKTTSVDASKLKVVDVMEAQSGITVMINVPDATAPWKCLSGKNGKVDGVEFTGTEGKL